MFKYCKNLLTRQRALFKSKRRGDSPRVIDTDLVHGSSTSMQNRVQLREKLPKLTNLSKATKTSYEKELLTCETLLCIHDIQCDLGNQSKVNET